MRVVVIGGGPAGVSAALHATELGARRVRSWSGDGSAARPLDEQAPHRVRTLSSWGHAPLCVRD